jgi:GNAT superfamily N-acetyltransferase
VEIRPGSVRDVPTVIGFFDEAVEWLVARGRAGQWGTMPWSTRPATVERITGMVERHGVWLAHLDDAPVGALIVGGDAQSYVPPVDEPELYVNSLVVSRRHAGRRVGHHLLQFAFSEARRRGVRLVRVDCYAGDDGALVEYYVRAGFTPAQKVDVDGWPGHILLRRLE